MDRLPGHRARAAEGGAAVPCPDLLLLLLLVVVLLLLVVMLLLLLLFVVAIIISAANGYGNTPTCNGIAK